MSSLPTSSSFSPPPIKGHALADVWLLLKKNFLIQFRHPLATAVELFFPCLLIVMLAYFRSQVNIRTVPEARIYESFDFERVQFNQSEYRIFYTPENETTGEVIDELLRSLNGLGKGQKFNGKFREGKSTKLTDSVSTL